MRTCRSCGAKISWAFTETGKRIPLSLASEERRLVVLREAGDGTPLVGVRTTYLSHFVDCPNSAEHRKPRTKE